MYKRQEYEAPVGRLIYGFPITATALSVGSKVVANVVALGAINALAGFVLRSSLRKAVLKHVPERFRALNEKALDAGEQLIEPSVGHSIQYHREPRRR